MSEAKRAGNKASGGLAGASRALKSPGLFNPRRFSWFLLLDQSVGALEPWPLCASHPRL